GRGGGWGRWGGLWGGGGATWLTGCCVRPASCTVRSSTSCAWARSPASTSPTPRSRSALCCSSSGVGATATPLATADELRGVSELAVPDMLAGERLDPALALLTRGSPAGGARLLDARAVPGAGQALSTSDPPRDRA